MIESNFYPCTNTSKYINATVRGQTSKIKQHLWLHVGTMYIIINKLRCLNHGHNFWFLETLLSKGSWILMITKIKHLLLQWNTLRCKRHNFIQETFNIIHAFWYSLFSTYMNGHWAGAISTNKFHTLLDELLTHLELCDHNIQTPYESCVFFWKHPAGLLDCGV